MVASLVAGKKKTCSFMPSSGKKSFFYSRAQIGFGTHTASYSMESGRCSLR
jgi:hypothetical protein